MLALSPGSAVPVARIVDLVWGERPAAHRGQDAPLVRRPAARGSRSGRDRTIGAAYRLEVPAGLGRRPRFQRSVGVDDAEAALAEWTGTPLAGLESDGLARHRRRAGRAATSSRSRRTSRGASRPTPAVVLGRLTELTATYPSREGLWALRMTALYRTGRQGDALAAYRAARRHLVEGLGVEPGPRLRELEAMILGQDTRLAMPGTGRPGNLPLRLGRLIGRDADVAAVRLALSSWPVVTLVGPGGIGKTRLAVAAAGREDDADGAWLVDLVEADSAADVPRAVAATLGVKETAGRGLTGSVVAALRARHTLLVLDNCEHVLDGAAALAQAVADGCPRTRVLVTSRERLGLRGGHERVMPVGPLDPDAGVAELFRERAAALAVSPALDPAGPGGAAPADPSGVANSDPVTEICRRLEGVPLAIELAAARTTTLRPADLLARLDDQLRLLVTIDGGQAARAGTARCGRPSSGRTTCSPRPSGRCCPASPSSSGPSTCPRHGCRAGPPTPANPAGRGRGPARRAGGAVDGWRSRGRWSVLPGGSGCSNLRQFAVERLPLAGESDLMADRHAGWCAGRVAAIHRLLAGQDEVAGVAALDELWPNLRSASAGLPAVRTDASRTRWFGRSSPRSPAATAASWVTGSSGCSP